MAKRIITNFSSNDLDEAYQVHIDSFFEKSPDFLTFQGFQSLAEAKSATILGLKSRESGENSLIGYILFRQTGPEAELLSMAIAPNSRNNGNGKTLLEAMLGHLKSGGASEIFLEVNEQNLAAIGLYSHAGFQQCGIRSGYYKNPEGQRQNAILMKITRR